MSDLSDRIQRAADEALEETIEWVANRARDKVPVRTGNLRDSIEEEVRRVVVKADYAAFVEYGTEKMEAQPYLRPAIEGAEEKFIEEFRKRL